MSEVTGSAPAAEGAPEGNTEPQEGAVKPETPPAPPSMKKKFQLKVDGEDIEEEIDFNDEEGMRSKLQLARAAKKRMAEAQAEKKKAFEIVKAFEADPKSVLARLGPKGRAIAEEFLLNQIQDDMLTPEQKELRDLKRENETFKEREAREKKEREEAQIAEKEKTFAESFQKTIIEALDKSGMPKSATNVKRLAFLMSKNIELGLELSPAELAEEWRQDRSKEHAAEFKDMTAEQFIALYGPEMTKKLRMHAVKELQEKQGMVFQNGKKVESPARSQEPQGPRSIEEYMEEARRRARGG